MCHIFYIICNYLIFKVQNMNIKEKNDVDVCRFRFIVKISLCDNKPLVHLYEGVIHLALSQYNGAKQQDNITL